jgi:hypothetical protein
VHFIKYYQGDKIREDDMFGALNTNARDNKCLQNFGQESYRAETTRRLRRRWENNTVMDLREMGCGVVDWMRLAQDTDH